MEKLADTYSSPVKAATRNTLMVGWSPLSKKIADSIIDNFRSQYELVGFVSLFSPDREEKKFYRGFPLLGKFEQLGKIIQSHNINHVVIGLDPYDRNAIHRVVEFCNQNNIEFEVLSQNYDVVYGQTVKYIARDVFAEWDFSIQRLISVVGALTLLVLFFPVFLFVALLVKLDSKGPIFYSQERVGKNGRIFRIIKFRTMVQDAEKVSGPQLATKNDPRITKVGRFLRKTRLDEIPQLINILLGDMAFIGPRPERPYFVDKYSRLIPLYKNRLRVKPGVTGLAQVYVGYDESLEDVKQKVHWDLYYIDKKSIWLDLKVLYQTLIVVLTAQGH